MTTRSDRLALHWGQTIPALCIGLWILTIVGAFAHWWRPQWYWIPSLFISVMTATLAHAWVQSARRRFIREAPLPRYLQRKLLQTYPHLLPRDAELIERGLRQFFLACAQSQRQFVAMPSQAVDTLWHEFILHTQAYRHWCQLALGHFLHHTPAEALGTRARHNDGLRRAWFWTCKEESIDPKAPTRLPLLFALDAKFAIPGGFHYLPDCRLTGPVAPGTDGSGGSPYCGTDFSDGGYSGSAGDFGGADGSDGGGDGGGCGGGGD